MKHALLALISLLALVAASDCCPEFVELRQGESMSITCDHGDFFVRDFAPDDLLFECSYDLGGGAPESDMGDNGLLVVSCVGSKPLVREYTPVRAEVFCQHTVLIPIFGG